jgi:hypothetical protein
VDWLGDGSREHRGSIDDALKRAKVANSNILKSTNVAIRHHFESHIPIFQHSHRLVDSCSCSISRRVPFAYSDVFCSNLLAQIRCLPMFTIIWTAVILPFQFLRPKMIEIFGWHLLIINVGGMEAENPCLRCMRVQFSAGFKKLSI